jgi:DNA polymerase III epsilon subunit-like protein
MKYFTHPIVIVDVETTGFGTTSEVIEIGAVCIDEYGRTRSEFGALIQHKNELDGMARRAMKINKITEEQLNSASSMEDIRARFINWWNQLPKDNGLLAVAFNQRFDSRRLNEIGINLPWGACLMDMTKNVMVAQGCTPLKANGHKKGRVSLKEACQFLGVEYPENAHRALEDCRVTALVACKISQFWKYEEET